MFSLINIIRGGTDKPEKRTAVRDFRIPLIGESAPPFTAESTSGTIHFPDDFGRNWKMIQRAGLSIELAKSYSLSARTPDNSEPSAKVFHYYA